MSARIVRMTAPLGKAILEAPAVTAEGTFCPPETDLPIKSELTAAPKKRTASLRVNGLARKPCNSFTVLLPWRPAAYNQCPQNQKVQIKAITRSFFSLSGSDRPQPWPSVLPPIAFANAASADPRMRGIEPVASWVELPSIVHCVRRRQHTWPSRVSFRKPLGSDERNAGRQDHPVSATTPS